MKRYLFLLLIIFQSFQLFSQIDKEFWFVGPEVSSNHGDRPVYIRISTMEDPAHITLRMPANMKFFPITQSIPPNSTLSIQLDNIGGNASWLDSIENRPANQVLNKGILLTSDNLITSYYEVANGNNPGIWPLKGKNALGTEFYISGQNNYANQTNDGSEAFDIVATEDNTTVTITPTLDIVGHPAGVPFQVTLNKGQTYSARTLNTSASASLMGSHVVSDKPVAITISDDSIITGGWDVIGDQIIPVNLLGWEYIVIKGFADNSPPSNNDEHAYILATQDNTEVRLDGNSTPVATLTTGQQYNYEIPPGSNTALIRVTNPSYVYHLSGHPGEAGASLLPQDSCTGSRKIGFNRSSTYAFALLILTRNGNQDSFYLNGNKNIITGVNFTVVPGSGNAWVYYRMNNLPLAQVPVGANLLENTNGKFHLGIINNVSASSEYGYFSDFSTLYLGADASMCSADSLVLDAGPYKSSYEWKKLISGIWTVVGIKRMYTVHDTGYYACMTNGDFCTLYDTIHVSYYPNGTVSLGSDRTICEGTTTTFDPGSYVSYLWSTGSTDRYLTTGTPGKYWIRVSNNNDCVASDTVILVLDSLPQATHSIIGPSPVCQGQNGAVFTISPLPYAVSYQWTIPPGTSGSSSTNSITLDISTSAASGNLKVHGINACGIGRDTTFLLTVDPLPLAAGQISGPGEVCQGQNGVVYSVPDIQFAAVYNWTLPSGASIVSGAGTKSITVNFALNAVPGNITVYGQNPCGTGASSMTSLLVRLFPVPAGTITGSSTVCQGQNGVIFSVAPITGADSYSWTVPPGATITNGSGTNTVTVYFDSTSTSGNITVKGHSNYCGDGLPSIFPVTVNPLPLPAGPISGPSTVCQGQTGAVYSISPVSFATTYIWSLPPGTAITSGSGTNSITVSFSTGAQSGIITVKGNNNLCGDGLSSSIQVTVSPLPAAPGALSGPATVCQATGNVTYSVPVIQYASSYIWTYSGSGTTFTNNGNSITMNFSAVATSGLLIVKGQNICGDGPVSPGLSITVNPISQVSLSVCNDITTRDAAPFLLKGGIPLGGTYTGTGVSGGTFVPSLVPVSRDTAVITYHYTNMFSCSNSATQVLSIKPAQTASCGNSFTDVRDNHVYQTIQIGGQCWMAANLNYGQQITSSTVQRDNCVSEKFCLNDDPATCTTEGGLYQWDELMQYDIIAGKQGLCPPAWHLPTETEWKTLFDHFITSGFAGSPLKYSGYSGFNALLTGIRGLNRSWSFDGFATFFWSSDAIGNYKAWAHGLNEINPSVSYYPAYRSNAFSVRCIKN